MSNNVTLRRESEDRLHPLFFGCLVLGHRKGDQRQEQDQDDDENAVRLLIF